MGASINNIMLSLTVFRALKRARLPIATFALAYVVSSSAGIIMVHTGNQFAINMRDNIVATSQNSTILVAYRSGNRLGAAFLDFASNLFLGAVTQTVGGLGVIFPYPVAAYRGWVGGIVSIDGNHASRLASPSEAAYYISVMVLQLIPYSLAGGAGVNLGLAYLRPPPYYKGDRWFGIPKEAVLDALRIYILVIPLFLAASLIEFLT